MMFKLLELRQSWTRYKCKTRLSINKISLGFRSLSSWNSVDQLTVSSHLFELCELTRLGNFIFLSIFVADKYIGNTHTLHVMQLDPADIAPHCVLWGW